MFSNTYIIFLVFVRPNDRDNRIVEEQAHREDSGEAISFEFEHGHIEGLIWVAEVGIDTPLEGEDQHNHNKSQVAPGADRVDLPEYRGVDEREECQADEGIHKVERLFGEYRPKYGVVPFFCVKKLVIRMRATRGVVAGSAAVALGFISDGICNNENVNGVKEIFVKYSLSQ